MTWIIIIILIVIVAFFIIGASMNQKQKEFEDDSLNDVTQKGIILTKQTKTYDGVIGIDEANKKLVFINSAITEQHAKTFNFEDIYSCELIIDDESVYKKSTLRTVGGALVGGVIMGGAGAIIGGLSGDSKKNSNIKKIELKIVVRDLSNPTHKFSFFGATSPSEYLSQKMREAEEWKDTISLVIDMEDSKK